MLEAGGIDGAGFFGLYWYILIPISLSGFVVVVIWQFTQIWNEFLFGVVITNTGSQPITVALQNLAGSQDCRMECADGGYVHDRFADAAGLYSPWTLFHSWLVSV